MRYLYLDNLRGFKNQLIPFSDIILVSAKNRRNLTVTLAFNFQRRPSLYQQISPDVSILCDLITGLLGGHQYTAEKQLYSKAL